MNLTLFQIETGLAQLLHHRQERLADKEDPPDQEELDAIEGEIRKYEIAEPAKVSGVAAMFRMWKAQRANIKAERDRLRDIDRTLEAMEKRLKEHVATALENAPIPKRAQSRTLMGADGSKLMLVRNGGLDPLIIDGWDSEEERWLTEQTVLPAIYETAVVRMPLSMYMHLSKEWEGQGMTTDNPFVLVSHAPDATYIRRWLATDCEKCDGLGRVHPEAEACPECDGKGKKLIPGARLGERGYHVQCR